MQRGKLTKIVEPLLHHFAPLESQARRVYIAPMPAPYQPKYEWTRTQIDKRDPPTDYDWMGYDGAQPIGRVRKEFHGPIKGKWQWVGWTPKPFRHSPPMPNLGYADTARLAVQMSERYWDKCHQIAAEKS